MQRRRFIESTGSLLAKLRGKPNFHLTFGERCVFRAFEDRYRVGDGLVFIILSARPRCGNRFHNPRQHSNRLHLRDTLLEGRYDMLDVSLAMGGRKEARKAFLDMNSLLPHVVIEKAAKA